MSKLAVTLVKSPIGNRPTARATVKALGLRRLHQTVYVPDNPSVRGMIFAVRHLVSLQEGVDGPPAEQTKRQSITIIRADQPAAPTNSTTSVDSVDQASFTAPQAAPMPTSTAPAPADTGGSAPVVEAVSDVAEAADTSSEESAQ